MLMLPVIVIVPVAVAAALFVNEKLPVPVVFVRLLIVRLVIEPWSRNVSASVPGSVGSPSPNAFGVGVGWAAGNRRDCPAVPPTGCCRIMKKQPCVAAAVYVPPPPQIFPLYEVTVYSPIYSVNIAGVGEGAGVGVALGVPVGNGVGVTVGVGVGLGDEYAIASQSPLCCVNVLPVTMPLVSMLV